MNNEVDYLIRKFEEDNDVIALKRFFNSPTFMEIYNSDRDEISYTSFLRWLFDPNYNYGLGNKPLYLLLKQLSEQLPSFDDLQNIEDIIFENIKTNYSTKEHGYPDLVIEFSIKNKEYSIILENKVYAKEGSYSDDKLQTDIYYDYFNELNDDRNYLFLFLTIDDTAHSEGFNDIHYKDIAKILKELMDNNKTSFAYNIINDFLNTLYKINILNTKENKPILDDEDLKNDNFKQLDNIRNNHQELYKLFESKDDVLKNYINNPINKIIISLIWKDLKIKRAENFSFKKASIPIGTELYFTNHQKGKEKTNIKVTTIDDDTGVLMDGKKTTLTKIACEKIGPGNRPINYFIYNDKNLGVYYTELMWGIEE